MAADAAAPKRRRWMLWALALTAAALVGLVAWIGVRAVLVKSEFDSLLPLAEQLRSAATEGDIDAVEAIAPALEDHATRAADLTSDPLWRGAEVVPFVGENLAALRVASAELAALSSVVPDLTGVARVLATAPADSIVDIATLVSVADRLDDAVTVLTRADSALRALDGELLPPVARGVEELRAAVSEIQPTATATSEAARALPSILGAEGPRSILVMIQNSAELRTGGGITGSFAELRADGGRLSLVQQADSGAFPERSESLIPLPESTTALYTDVVGRYVQNASMTADFETTAQLASAWWHGLTGRTPDTVLSVDPFVLQALLSVTGPVALPDGTELGSDNVVDKLLVAPYRTLASEEQTSYFSAAVESIFGRVSGGALDPLALVRALAAPVADGRISVWSSHDAENDILRASALGGPAARQDAAGEDAYAVYFNDSTGAKMAGYLDVSITAGVEACRPDGTQVVLLSVTIGSSAPADVETLPISVTGGGLFGVGNGDIGTNISVSAPRDAYLGGVVVKGEPYAGAAVIEQGRPSAAARVNLSPGEVNTIDYRFIVPRDHGALRILHTPLLNAPAIEVMPAGCS